MTSRGRKVHNPDENFFGVKGVKPLKIVKPKKHASLVIPPSEPIEIDLTAEFEGNPPSAPVTA